MFKSTDSIDKLADRVQRFSRGELKRALDTAGLSYLSAARTTTLRQSLIRALTSERKKTLIESLNTAFSIAAKKAPAKKAKKAPAKKAPAKKADPTLAQRIMGRISETNNSNSFAAALSAAAETRAEAKSKPAGRRRRPGVRAELIIIRQLILAGNDGFTTLAELQKAESADMATEGMVRTPESTKAIVRYIVQRLDMLSFFNVGEIIRTAKGGTLVVHDPKVAKATLKRINAWLKADEERVQHNLEFPVVGDGKHHRKAQASK